MDERAGPRPVHLERSRRHRPNHAKARARYRRHLPSHSLPPRPRRADGRDGDAPWDIRSTRLFDGLVKGVTVDQVANMITCGPDPQKHIGAIRQFADAGFDHVFIHQVGPGQKGFFRFCEREVLPQIARVPARV